MPRKNKFPYPVGSLVTLNMRDVAAIYGDAYAGKWGAIRRVVQVDADEMVLVRPYDGFEESGFPHFVRWNTVVGPWDEYGRVDR